MNQNLRRRRQRTPRRGRKGRRDLGHQVESGLEGGGDLPQPALSRGRWKSFLDGTNFKFLSFTPKIFFNVFGLFCLPWHQFRLLVSVLSRRRRRSSSSWYSAFWYVDVVSKRVPAEQISLKVSKNFTWVGYLRIYITCEHLDMDHGKQFHICYLWDVVLNVICHIFLSVMWGELNTYW